MISKSDFLTSDGVGMKRNELLSIRKNCIYCLKLIGKRSKEHPVPKSIGGKLVFPLICGKCNNDLGSIVDSHWTWDCWMKFAKDQLGLPEFKFKSKLIVSDLQNKYFINKLPNGKEQIKAPFTQDGAWRAAVKMAYELCAMDIGNYIFQSEFAEVRHFIQTGELPVQQKGGSISLHLGDGFNILRISYDTMLAPWHMFDFKDMGDFLSIHMAFFNYYSFSTTFKINIKALKLKTLEHPFRVVQELRPENKLYFVTDWNDEQKK